MKKLQIFKLIVFTLFVFALNSGQGQTASDWTRLYNNAKKTLSKFPTVSQIDSLSLPSKSKQWILDTRKTFTRIAENQTAPDKEIAKQLFTKVNSLPKDFQGYDIMQKDNGSGPNQETTKTCLDKYNECIKFFNCPRSTPCYCCQACDVEYIGCIMGTLVISGRTNIKTRTPGTATHNK